MMKYVIRHDHEEALRMDPAFVDGMTPAQFGEAKQNFLRRGILSHRLLRRMWAPLGLSDSQFERLVQLLEQFEIALGLPDDGSEPRLLVPSFLREPLPEGAWPRDCTADMREAIHLFDLGNFVPDCFMQRLLVPLCALLSSRDRSRFSCDGAVIRSGRSRLLVRLKQTTLEVAVRAKDEATAWRTMHSDALPRVVSVLSQWPSVAYDIWVPWTLRSGEKRLFSVKDLWAERRRGNETVDVAAFSEAWGVLTSTSVEAEASPLSSGRSHHDLEDEEVPLAHLLGPATLKTKEVVPQRRASLTDEAPDEGESIAPRDEEGTVPVGIEAALEQAEIVLDIADLGLGTSKTKFVIATVTPTVAVMCQLAQCILGDVRSLKDNADDVAEAGRKIADVLEFAEAMNAEQQAYLEEKMASLPKLLGGFQSCVRAFGEQAWLAKAWGTRKYATLAKLDRDITRALDAIRLEIGREEKLATLVLETRQYPLGMAMDKKIERKATRDGTKKDEAAEKLSTDVDANQQVAEMGNVPDAVLREELKHISSGSNQNAKLEAEIAKKDEVIMEARKEQARALCSKVAISYRMGESMTEMKQLESALQAEGIEVFRSSEAETGGLDLMSTIAQAFDEADMIVVACTLTYGRKTNELYSTFQELMFIKNEKLAADVLYIRMLPFEEKFSEATTRMMMGDRLYGSVWMPGDAMPDDLVSKIMSRLAKRG